MGNDLFLPGFFLLKWIVEWLHLPVWNPLRSIKHTQPASITKEYSLLINFFIIYLIMSQTKHQREHCFQYIIFYKNNKTQKHQKLRTLEQKLRMEK